MKLFHSRGLLTLTAVLLAVACGDDINANPNGPRPDPDGGARAIPGGELEDEKFPAYLLEPYTGPPVDYYDNTGIGFVQLRGRVKRVFADAEIGGNTDAYLAAKVELLGGADFVTRYAEARVLTPDFLLALDGVAKDACQRASTNKTGPFAGTNPAADGPGGASALAGMLYERMLFRQATPQELTEATGLVDELVPLSTSKVQAWAGLCEMLVRHPDSIFTLPPSVSTTGGAEKERLQLVKLANDLVGRPPLADEMTSLVGKTVDEKVAFYIGTPDFRDFYFHRARLRTESIGTPEADEPAKLWTYLATTGAPLQDLLIADYTVDGNLARINRAPEHGKTGVLTMPGFIKTKQGLPHYNYPARVMSDFMGQLFEVSPDIISMRINSTVSSTVEPGSKCIACHGVLTPLATQRLKWRDDGTYRTTDDNGAPLDDSDRGMVPDYPYKGAGIESFAVQAARKERFLRQTFQSQFLFFLGRPMRFDLDERTVYLALWLSTFDKKGDFRELLKIIANVPTYLGQ